MSPTTLAAPIRLRADDGTAPGQVSQPVDAMKPLFDEAILLGVTDPWRRSGMAQDLLEQAKILAAMAQRIRDGAVRVLIEEQNAPRTRVALHLGVSIGRISQLVTSKGRARGGRAADERTAPISACRAVQS